MTISQYRHRRTSDPTKTFPNPLEPGEIAVNTSNRQLAVGDAQSGSTGIPVPLIPVRFFDARAIYATNDMVTQGGVIYRALRANGPHAFLAADWEGISGVLSPLYVATAGGTMTGSLILNADPAVPLGAATKQYVDFLLSAKQTVLTADTPPAGAPDNTLWWESDSGILYLRYNDGNSTQWVIASPEPDTTSFVQRAGDTMSGLLSLSGPPTRPLHAATKQYIDNAILGSGGFVDAPTDGTTYGRKNAAWQPLPNITVSSTAPSSPAVNDVWIDTT